MYTLYTFLTDNLEQTATAKQAPQLVSRACNILLLREKSCIAIFYIGKMGLKKSN